MVIDRKGVAEEEVKVYIDVWKDSKVDGKGWRGRRIGAYIGYKIMLILLLLLVREYKKE